MIVMRICIDAGHNDSGFDTGAVGNGYREQDITFEIASRLAALLYWKGYDVIETRPTKQTNLGAGVNSSINTRVKISNDFNADLFISIHCNDADDASANGTETLVYKKGGKAQLLASYIQDQIVTKLHLTSRGVKEKSIGVLRLTNCPAVLVECGFIKNKKDIEVITQYDKVARLIYDAILEYLGDNQIEPKLENVPSTVYERIGVTEIIEIDPRNIFSVITKKKTWDTKQENFVNGIFFIPQAIGYPAPNGIMVNAGVVLANNATHGLPVSTLIVRGPSDVEVKKVFDITLESNVWFAISGFGLYPKITAEEEGFKEKFSDVLRTCHRPIIGYRKADNKIVIAVRPNTSAVRAFETARNLKLDCAISLDAGGSTTLKINNKLIYPGDGRVLFGGITWK